MISDFKIVEILISVILERLKLQFRTTILWAKDKEFGQNCPNLIFLKYCLELDHCIVATKFCLICHLHTRGCSFMLQWVTIQRFLFTIWAFWCGGKCRIGKMNSAKMTWYKNLLVRCPKWLFDNSIFWSSSAKQSEAARVSFL